MIRNMNSNALACLRSDSTFKKKMFYGKNPPQVRLFYKNVPQVRLIKQNAPLFD